MPEPDQLALWHEVKGITVVNMLPLTRLYCVREKSKYFSPKERSRSLTPTANINLEEELVSVVIEN